MRIVLICLLVLFSLAFAEEVSHVKRVGDVEFRLYMENRFTRGEPIEGYITVRNLSEKAVQILRPLRLGRWRAQIEGPRGGHYEYRGVKYKIARLSMKLFIPLKAGETLTFPFTLGNYLPQEAYKKDDFDWSSVVPGEYRVTIKLESAIDNLNSFNVQFKGIDFTVAEE